MPARTADPLRARVRFEDSVRRIGYLAVYSRLQGLGGRGDDDFASLEELTHRATPAIENARKYR